MIMGILEKKSHRLVNRERRVLARPIFDRFELALPRHDVQQAASFHRLPSPPRLLLLPFAIIIKQPIGRHHRFEDPPLLGGPQSEEMLVKLARDGDENTSEEGKVCVGGFVRHDFVPVGLQFGREGAALLELVEEADCAIETVATVVHVDVEEV